MHFNGIQVEKAKTVIKNELFWFSKEYAEAGIFWELFVTNIKYYLEYKFIKQSTIPAVKLVITNIDIAKRVVMKKTQLAQFTTWKMSKWYIHHMQKSRRFKVFQLGTNALNSKLTINFPLYNALTVINVLFHNLVVLWCHLKIIVIWFYFYIIK